MAKRQPWTQLCVVLRRFRNHNNHQLNNDHNNDDLVDDGPRDDYNRSRNDYNNRSRNDHDYNGGRKGYYNPSINYDHLINYDNNSGATALTASTTPASPTDDD